MWTTREADDSALPGHSVGWRAGSKQVTPRNRLDLLSSPRKSNRLSPGLFLGGPGSIWEDIMDSSAVSDLGPQSRPP